MALTRKFLKALGIEDEKAEEIIQAHVETTDALKGENGELRDLLDAAKRQKAKPAKNDGDGEPKGDDGANDAVAALQKEFDAYKANVEAEKAEREKRSLYRSLLEKAGIDSKRIASVLKVSDLTDVKVKDGAIEDADKLVEAIKADWADFIPKITTEGANVANPPKGAGGAVTKEQFAKMSLRQRNELYESDRAAYDALVNQD